MESNFIQIHSFEYQINKSNSLFVKKYLNQVNLNPQKIFIYDSNTSYTGKMIKKKIQYYIRKLKKGNQDIVILKSKNSANWVIIYLAIKILNKLAFIVSDSIDKNNYELLQNNFHIHSIFENDKLKFIKNKKKISFSKINLNKKKENKILDCIFTTGTTGKPKGVLVSEKAYLHTANVLINKSQQNINDIELLSMPFSHSFGIARLRASILNGQSFMISDGLKNFPKIYRDFFSLNINGLSLVPSALEIIRAMLRNNSLKFGKKIKYLEIGSSSLNLNTRKWLSKNFKNTIIFHHYGMTEASRSFFIDRGTRDKYFSKENFVGDPADKVKFKLNDKKNLPNEIIIKGPHLADSYFYLEKNIKIKEIGKWFHTGDKGHLKNNKLILKGRFSSMINVGGQKVYSEEIEEIIEKITGVNTVLCCAIFDRIMGEVPGVLVKKDDKYDYSDDRIVSSIKKSFKFLPNYKVPKKIVFDKGYDFFVGGKKSRDKKKLEKLF